MKLKYLLLAVFLIPVVMSARYTCQGNETVFIPECICQSENLTIVPNNTEYNKFAIACYDFLDALYNRTEGVTKLGENYANCVAAGEMLSKDLQEARSEKIDYAKCMADLNTNTIELTNEKSGKEKNMLLAAIGGFGLCYLIVKRQEKPAAVARMDRE